jgi:hypothetical protein
VWWHTVINLALGRLRQEYHEFKVSLGYIERLSITTTTTTTKQTKSINPFMKVVPLIPKHLTLGPTSRCCHIEKLTHNLSLGRDKHN